MRMRSLGSSQIRISSTVRPRSSACEYPYLRSNASLTSSKRPSPTVVMEKAMGLERNCFLSQREKRLSRGLFHRSELLPEEFGISALRHREAVHSERMPFLAAPRA
jgi:hypothetical protein